MLKYIFQAQYDDANSVHIMEADGTRIEVVSLPSTDLPEMVCSCFH